MSDVDEEKPSWFTSGSWLLGLLCFVTFLATITTGQEVFDNAWMIFRYEAVFVGAFIAFRLTKGFPADLIPVKSIGFWLLVLWVASITLSLLRSPYDLVGDWFAVQRYYQTLFHIVFFLCLYGFFSTYQGSVRAVMISLAASVGVLALLFVAAWLTLSEPIAFDSNYWFLYPPCNAHIRITGFLVAAGTVALLPFFSEKIKSKWIAVSYYSIGILTWALMFWTGGRGSILSALIACVAIAFILKIKKQPLKHVLIAMAVFVVGGILLAELSKIFFWNGIFQAAERTVAAGVDPNGLTTGRIMIWGWVIETLNNEHSWFLGLGSQGYFYMPNRTFAFQPHNLVFQFLAEWGICGTALFLAMMGYGLLKGARKRLYRATGEISVTALAALGIILSLGLHSLVDGIFYHAQPSMHLAIAFAIWMSAEKKV
jgi:hypothetical protein